MRTAPGLEVTDGGGFGLRWGGCGRGGHCGSGLLDGDGSGYETIDTRLRYEKRGDRFNGMSRSI